VHPTPAVAPIHVIVNETAGSGEAAKAIADAFASAGVDATITCVAGPRLAEEAARAAASGGIIVAVGGDGTVSAARVGVSRSSPTHYRLCIPARRATLHWWLPNPTRGSHFVDLSAIQ